MPGDSEAKAPAVKGRLRLVPYRQPGVDELGSERLQERMDGDAEDGDMGAVDVAGVLQEPPPLADELEDHGSGEDDDEGPLAARMRRLEFELEEVLHEAWAASASECEESSASGDGDGLGSGSSRPPRAVSERQSAEHRRSPPISPARSGAEAGRPAPSEAEAPPPPVASGPSVARDTPPPIVRAALAEPRQARQESWAGARFMLAPCFARGAFKAWSATCNVHTQGGGRCNKNLNLGTAFSDAEAKCRVKEWCLRGIAIADEPGGREIHMSDNPRFLLSVRSAEELDDAALELGEFGP